MENQAHGVPIPQNGPVRQKEKVQRLQAAARAQTQQRISVLSAFWKNVLGTLLAAAIVANVTLLFRFNEKLARIETKIENIERVKLAQK